MIRILALILLTQLAFGQSKNPKRGVAYGHHTNADLQIISKGVSWWYNWYHHPESEVIGTYSNYDLDFVPMAWNADFKKDGLRSFLKKSSRCKVSFRLE